MKTSYDVAIIGGGPAGATCGSLLRKYNPNLRVLILEREVFPRDHVGESQLPPVSRVLHEMGCWDKVEAANFPIKIGATYRWGKSKELWDFEFFPGDRFVDEPRPAKFAGQRQWTAFQVDRAIYDKILLDHAESLGCEVRQGTRVRSVNRDEDRVLGLTLEDGEEISSTHYVDASGHSGILRRAMGVESVVSTSLQNIAIWDYWQNADWAVEIGVGGTRVQVLSLPYGWIWFIPLGPTRTSVGLVLPASYYKSSGKRPAELYAEALASEPKIQSLMENAVSEHRLESTKDWSFVADRQVGENWFLVGESGGFADPILAAGLTMAQVGAKELATTILELERGRFRPDWLREQYEERQHSRIRAHIRFADYWYSANSQFTDLKEFTAVIAAENGLDLTPDRAWAWLAQGGFIDSDANLGPAGFSIDQLKSLGEFLADVDAEPVVRQSNVFRLNLNGATKQDRAEYAQGKIEQTETYVREGRYLPLVGVFRVVVSLLEQASELPEIVQLMRNMIAARKDQQFNSEIIGRIPHALAAMISDGWVEASYRADLPLRDLPERVAQILHWNRDPVAESL